MVDESQKYIIISYCTCMFAVVSFAAYAVALYTIQILRENKRETTESFLTARGTQGTFRIAWSFFATAVGAWCIVSPASFAVYTGILGLAMYAFSSGFPLFVIALMGNAVQKRYPHVLTMPDFIGYRYGPVFKTFCVCVVLFNLSIAMLAEYTTIGALFRDFVGSVNYPPIIVVGILTMAYTAYGGLYISIITDQAQAMLSVALIILLTIYVAVSFREPLEKPLPDYLGVTKAGYSSIFSMPVSLMSATIFSEAMWQKVWASAGRKQLAWGGFIGAWMVTFAVFIFGFGGWLANWAGLINFDTTNPNLYLFQVFAAQNQSEDGSSATVSSWVGVLTLILAVTMNESAIDSMQTGITATIAAHFLADQHVIFARIALLFVNIPLMIVALQNYQILSLFLMTNTLTVCCAIPVALGLVDRLKPYLSESAALCGCITAMLTVTAYGIGRNWYTNDYGEYVDDPVSYGAWYTWYGNVQYWWDYFLVASGFSVVGMLLWAVPAYLLRRCGINGPGITGVLRFIPGFKVLTGSGLGFDLLGFKVMAPLARLLKYDPASFSSPNYAKEADADKIRTETGAVAVTGPGFAQVHDEEKPTKAGKEEKASLMTENGGLGVVGVSFSLHDKK